MKKSATKENSTEVAVAPRAITLEEALARHNARHPEARLLDITDELRALKIARLLDLIENRIPADSNQQQALARYVEQPEEPETLRDRESTLLLIATIYAMRYTLRRRGWVSGQLREALSKTGDPVTGKAILRRMNRASGLLDRLIWIWAAREYRRKGGEAA